ncbi:MAG: glucuronyl hydrolase [Acidobacteria bacterium]|nr:glucuronyl hydrolase [Acidobacteriota bacterium]
MRFAEKQVKRLIDNQPGYYPMYTAGGRWKHEGPSWTRWCDGFLPGMMWMFRRYESDHGGKDPEYWYKKAVDYTRPLEARKDDNDVHGLGFVFHSSFYRWYQVDRDPKLEQIVIEAGRTLAKRYKDKGHYLRSFVAENSLFIDIMMNVGIVFYAARATGDKTLRDIATRHSLTTRRYLVRGDGSTAHEGIFDLETGEFLREATQQGYRADSCWARGLAWAMYGFATSYEYSRDPHFLETAEDCADYYVTHAQADGICAWDFNAPAESRKQVDTSAAAIAACGFLRLSRLLHDPIKGHFFWNTGIRILRTLCSNHLGDKEKEWEGVLKGSVYHMNKGLGVGESSMWGDHYFVEALEHALRRI